MNAKTLMLACATALALSASADWTLELNAQKKEGTITSGDVVLKVEVFSAAERKLTVRGKNAWTAPTLDLRGAVSDGEEAWTIAEIRCASSSWSGIKTLYLPDTQEIISGAAFANIAGLTKIEPMFPASITNIGSSAFRNTQIEGDLVISNPNFVEVAPQAFQGEEDRGHLTSVDLSGTSVAKIGRQAFFGQKRMTSVKLPAESVLELIDEESFQSCSTLASLTPEEHPFLKKIGKSAFSMSSVMETGLIVTNCETVGGSAFYMCKKLLNFVGPQVTDLGANNTFMGCSALTNVELNAAVQLPGSCFNGCTELARLTPTCFPHSQVEWYAFRNTSKLVCGLDFPAATNMPAVVKSGDNDTFYESGITSIKMPNVRSVEKISFRNCRNLGDAYLPACTNLGNEVFSGCNSITNVVCSPDLAVIGNAVFYVRSSLRTFFPTTFKKLTSSGTSVFAGCSSLTGDFVFDSPEYRNMKASMFSSCSSITSVVFKASAVTNVGNQALAKLAPGACIYFYHDCPTFGPQNAIYSISATPVNRMRIYANGAKTSAAWAAEVAPYKTIFEQQKAKPAVDYPGDKAIGMIRRGDDYAWVIDWRPPTALTILVR